MDNSNNTHSPINCTNPCIVLNHSFYIFYLQGFTIHLLYQTDKGLRHDTIRCSSSPESEESLSRRLLWFKYNHVSVDNCYSNFYFERDGIKYPVFYLFACGRCKLCRSKKSSEYCFRAACETFTYPVNPLFVTLTYAPSTLPSEGLCLRDLQNFFKRLRFRLDQFGYSTNFRYLAVGEYGSKEGRPHYHIIFWNLPSDTPLIQLRMQSFIRYAWTRFHLDDNGSKISFVLPKSHKRVYSRESIGIVKILPVTEGCPSYITKYFQKDCPNVCNYPGKTFLVSSRGNGGIGSQYIDSQRSFYDNCLSIPSLSVYEPTCGRIFEYPLTGYIKSRLFPSLSGCFTKCISTGVTYYAHLSRMAGFIHDMLAVSHFISKDVPNSLYNILRWDKVSVFCKRTKYFFRAFSRAHYLREYSFYRHLSFDRLVDRLADLLNNFIAMFDMIDWKFVDSRLSFYRGFLYIKKIQNEKNFVFYYNIPDNLTIFGQSYDAYLTKCHF